MTKQTVSSLAVVLVLLAASPSAAIVVLNCTDLGNGVVELSYDATQEASRVRAFSLDVRVSAGIITSIGNLNPDYCIYAGSIIFDEYGEVVDWGTPIADSSYPGTLSGLGTGGMTIEMGSLYVGEVNAPPSTGVLLTFTVSAECDVTVTENAARGGVILEEPPFGAAIYAPPLLGVLPPEIGVYDGGAGTADDPYLISTPEQMNAIGVNPGDWHRHFKLAADIDLSGYTGTDFNIIGNNINPFGGIFDGNNCRIYNFTYSSTDSDFVGLFGFVDGSGAEIKDLCLDEPNVSDGRGYDVGSLVGCLKRGTISCCCADGGSVSGGDCIGGLVGRNYDGTITNCYARVDVLADSNAGGLVGRGYEAISNCYSTANVSQDANVVGGLVGYNHGIISNSFWDKETSGQANGVGGTGETGVTEVAGRTTAQMQTASTFIDAGWDFDGESVNGTEDIWTIREGKTYPRFVRQIPKGDFVGREGVDMADFVFFAGYWMENNCADSYDCDGTDLDGSGTVDTADLMMFVDNWLIGIE
jgi:hypothetical protein